MEDYKKKYEEALKRAKGFKTDEYRDVAEYIFPELAESEDERIRKELIRVFSNREKYVINQSFGDINVSDILSWLEKQSEKPQRIVSAEAKEAMYDKPAPVKTGPIGFDGEPMESKPCEQKPAENKGMDLVEEEMTPFQKKVFCIVDTTIEEEQGLSNICNELLALAKQEIEQKPAELNDDDKQYLLVCKNALYKYQVSDKWDATIISRWLEDKLKSLKDRVQHKQEWSEEDKKILDGVITNYESGYLPSVEKRDEIIEKLKSLRPQSQWKPSTLQIEALESATENCAYSEYQDCLRELAKQLKKL